MIEPGGGLRFQQESPLTVGIGDFVRGQSFQSYYTVQTGVASLIDLAHSSGPD
jgi:hypothetical protein